MEKILPIEPVKSFDSYHDSLTHHFTAPVFYDTLRREVSFAKREGNRVGVIKFLLLPNTSMDQLLYFANELERKIRHHDLVARIAEREFVVLLRFDFDITSAAEALVCRMANVEKREFLYTWASSDGTKGLEDLLEELDNPQLMNSSKSL
jgi:GGDEF domain-containing protein